MKQGIKKGNLLFLEAHKPHVSIKPFRRQYAAATRFLPDRSKLPENGSRLITLRLKITLVCVGAHSCVCVYGAYAAR